MLHLQIMITILVGGRPQLQLKYLNTLLMPKIYLWGHKFREQLSAGSACLAALPAQSQHLVPEPYDLLTLNDAAEDICGQCMNPENSVFDI